MMFKVYFLLNIIIINSVRIKQIPLEKADTTLSMSTFPDEEDSFAEANKAIDNLSVGHADLFSEQYYNTVKPDDILTNTAMLVSNGSRSVKAAHRLNGIMNKVWEGEEHV